MATYTLDEVDVPDSPEAVFEALFANVRAVCQTCFTRLGRQQDTENPVALTTYRLAGGRNADLVGHVEDAGDDESLQLIRHVRSRPRREPAYPAAGEETDACGHCGTVDYHEPPSTPRSTTEAITAAVGSDPATGLAGISRTLVEYGVAHDPITLATAVERNKRTPELAGDDHAVFQDAVARAIAVVR